jgi:hypothetical protein
LTDEEQVKFLKDKGVKAWNEWREANPAIRPNFRRANLSGANLSGANLRAVTFRETDLRQANLREANLNLAIFLGSSLGRANFGRADFSFATFSGIDFKGAKLNGAKLNEARFIETDFAEANLVEANFTKSIMERVQFGNVDLSQCKGLETVEHMGPSTIGIDTIYRSGGNIPESFLRRAGVPEPFIANMKALVGAMSPIEFYSCFISYSHADKAFARRLHEALQSKGVRCWLDEHELLPGDDIYKEVDRGIRLWDKMLLCCSENSLKSWWVDNEIGTAFEKEQQLMKEREAKVQVLVPLNLDGYLFSDKWQSGYQAQVRRRLAVDFTEAGDAAKFDERVERLIKALRADEGAREKPPKQKL